VLLSCQIRGNFIVKLAVVPSIPGISEETKLNFRIPEPVFLKLVIYIMALEPISTAYFINPSHQSVSGCVSPIVARQQLDKSTTAAITRATIELLDTSFSVWSVSYQGK
jgi:hypothetical protein